MLDALVISGDSKLGGLLVETASASGLNFLGTTRHFPVANGLLPFDLRWTSYLPPARMLFLCSGINGFKPCETNREEAHYINVACNLAAARRMLDANPEARIVVLSSCAAESHPNTAYGSFKLETEAGIIEMGGAAVRFGPVALEGRFVYPNGPYYPIAPNAVISALLDLRANWKPGLHRILNEPSPC